MRFPQHIVVAAAAAAIALVPAGAAMAHGHSYIGSWPVTISNTQFDNGTGCLTFTGSGTSGQASFVLGSQKYPYGSFVVQNGIIVVNITEPLYGQNGVLMFMAHANMGRITVGDFEDVRGGSNFQFGSLVFGTKNGC